MYSYRINQFAVESDVALPCDHEADISHNDDYAYKVRIHASNSGLDEFPDLYWMGRRQGGPMLYAYPMLRAYEVGTGVLIYIDQNVRMFIARSGDSIQLRFDASDNWQRTLACACAVNLGLSISTLFQGNIPLHGAGLELDSKFISLVAPSGTGKSTLLWALLDQGARFACDDVTPVYCESGSVMAIPSLSLPAKLASKEIANRGLCQADYPETLPGQDEYWVPIPRRERVLERQPLSAIFVLRPFDSPKLPGTVHVLRNQGAVALSSLLENTQGLWAVYGMLNPEDMFTRCKQIAASVPIYTLRYHRHPSVVSHLACLVRQIVNDGLLGLTDQAASCQNSVDRPENS